MTREELRATLTRIIAVANFMARWTPNKVDDKVVEYLQLAVTQDWLLDLLLKLLNSGQPLTLDLIKAETANLPA